MTNDKHLKYNPPIDGNSLQKTEITKARQSVGFTFVMKNTIEIWKKIDGYSRYEISNLGNVKFLERMIGSRLVKEFILKLQPMVAMNKKGGCTYYQVLLINDEGIRRTNKIHRLIAKAFIPNPDNKPYINHINGDGSDNRIENLEWCTPSENVLHSIHVLGNKPPVNMLGRTGAASHMSKAVRQMDLEGNEIAVYPSMKDAGEAVGVHKQTIACVVNKIKNSKSAAGFRWEYVENNILN